MLNISLNNLTCQHASLLALKSGICKRSIIISQIIICQKQLNTSQYNLNPKAIKNFNRPPRAGFLMRTLGAGSPDCEAEFPKKVSGLITCEMIINRLQMEAARRLSRLSPPNR